MRDSVAVLVILVAVGIAAAAASEGGSGEDGFGAARKVAPRVPELRAYPCSKCHKGYKAGELSRELRSPHQGMELRHMPEVRKCVFCHDARAPDSLNLLDGARVGYDEAYRLCSQCHGLNGYDWKRGMHGRLQGKWSGEHLVFNCTSCHEAHDPQFKPMEAKPGPPPPWHVILKGDKE